MNSQRRRTIGRKASDGSYHNITQDRHQDFEECVGWYTAENTTKFGQDIAYARAEAKQICGKLYKRQFAQEVTGTLRDSVSDDELIKKVIKEIVRQRQVKDAKDQLAVLSPEDREKVLDCLRKRAKQVPNEDYRTSFYECYRTISQQGLVQDWVPSSKPAPSTGVAQSEPMGHPSGRVGMGEGLKADLPGTQAGTQYKLYQGRSQPKLYGPWNFTGPQHQGDKSRMNLGNISKGEFMKLEMKYFQQRNRNPSNEMLKHHREVISEWWDEWIISKPIDRGAKAKIPLESRSLVKKESKATQDAIFDQDDKLKRLRNRRFKTARALDVPWSWAHDKTEDEILRYAATRSTGRFNKPHRPTSGKQLKDSARKASGRAKQVNDGRFPYKREKRESDGRIGY